MTLLLRLRYTSELTEDDLVVPDNIIGFTACLTDSFKNEAAFCMAFVNYCFDMGINCIDGNIKIEINQCLAVMDIFYHSITDPMDTIYFWIEKEPE
jgi:hypothetical protein